MLDLATGTVTKIHDSLPQPGTPTWSPDGKRIALAGIAPMTVRFREGTNQVQTIAATGGDVSGTRRCRCCRSTHAAAPDRSGRPTARRWRRSTKACCRCGRSPSTGEPLGPPRRMTSESAHSPSWQGDSRHILYQSLDQLRIVDIETGETQHGAVRPDMDAGDPEDAGRRARRQAARHEVADAASNVDVTVDRQPHHLGRARMRTATTLKAEVVDASDLTVMPGLTEFHSHLQKDYGAAQGRAWLAFGVTTVRSPGNTPYEAVEDREANEAGVRPGPRVYGTGYLMEWDRVYYKMGIAISSVSQFEMELQRAKVLQHDLIKSYVRLPDLQQKRMVEFAHSIGVPVATHEIFPASLIGVDNTEHTAATSRRGYSPKMATQQTAYEDVVQLFGKSQRIFCPMISGGGARELFEKDRDAEERSALQAVSGVDPAPGCGAAGDVAGRRRRRPARRQRQDGARHHEGRRPGRGRHRHAERASTCTAS